ncbi:MAG: hypothetical protein RIC95_12140 [Vicingaceae bacterium]
MKNESRISYIELLPNNLVRVEVKKDIELEPEDLDENFKIYKSLLGDQKGLFLIVFHEGGQSNAETRAKFANNERAAIKQAEALVINNLAHRIESNFYKNVTRPDHPVEVFTEEQSAKEWLLDIK